MKIMRVLFLFFALLYFTGCSAHTGVEPAGKDNFILNASIGGPIVKAFDTKFPVPYITTGGLYGLSDNSNIFADLHLTSIPYSILGFNFGASFFPITHNNWVPTIGFSASLLSFISIKSDVESRIKAYPTFSSTASWHIYSNLLFTGIDLTIPFSKSDYDNSPPKFIFSPFLGYRIELGNNIRLTTEIKWQGANILSFQIPVEYTRVGKNGAVAILFAFERSF